jgi:hypothetical protein
MQRSALPRRGEPNNKTLQELEQTDLLPGHDLRGLLLAANGF